ncbi:hypothetical protein [Streptomyces afghaniensis]|uniref:hypothetical protein n=1 Tax=Streptomyces afghaniensis TaxID=66865 RepID=UPI003795EAF0
MRLVKATKSLRPQAAGTVPRFWRCTRRLSEIMPTAAMIARVCWTAFLFRRRGRSS